MTVLTEITTSATGTKIANLSVADLPYRTLAEIFGIADHLAMLVGECRVTADDGDDEADEVLDSLIEALRAA